MQRQSCLLQDPPRAASVSLCTSSRLISASNRTHGGRCEAFAAQGCIVYATARKLQAIEGLAHANIRHLALDVTSDDNVKVVVQAIVAAEGQIDILVNNAGISNSGEFP